MSDKTDVLSDTTSPRNAGSSPAVGSIFKQSAFRRYVLRLFISRASVFAQ
jgi:hypothetical protein